ncbi:MAG: VOC family protein [Pseudomonadota bacterium]
MTQKTLGAVLEAGLYVDDLEAAEAFYGGVLNLQEVLRFEGRHIFYQAGRTILLLFDPAVTVEPSSNSDMPVPPHGARGPGHLCFAAEREEIEEWCTRLRDAGHEIEADFEWPNGARSVYFRDPAGNSLEIAEPKLWF